MPSNDIPKPILSQAVTVIRQFALGEYGIALGGSYAKGISDEQSDIDIDLFARQVLPKVERDALVERTLGKSARCESWGEDAPFIEGGTDFWVDGRKVECWLRNTEDIQRILNDCLAGRIRRDCVYWTVMGFYNYAALSDVHAMQVLEDASGILGRWKAQIEAYPEPLRRAIVKRFLPEARFWPDNYHYTSAVKRGDILYTRGIVQQTVYALIQVVFALNRVYFPGEKKLEASLAKLEAQPQEFYPRIRALVYPGDAGEVQHLKTQQQALGELVQEVSRLADDAGA